MQEKKLLQRNTTAAEVAKILRQRILNGEFPEGEFIRQEAIALELGVSRIPVREALALLESEGIVIREKYRGALVPKLSVDEIREIYTIRGMLEPFLLESAIPNITEATRTQAQDLIRKSHDCEDHDEWAELNWSFHKTLYSRAGQPLTMQILEQLLLRADRYLKMQRFLSPEMQKESDEQHLEILHLIADGKPKEAVDALKKHIAWNETDMQETFDRARTGRTR